METIQISINKQMDKQTVIFHTVEHYSAIKRNELFLHITTWICCCCSLTQWCPLFATPWTAADPASLAITNSWSLLKLMSIESVMPSNHLILCRPLLLIPSIFLSIRIFSNKSALCIRWTKYWSFSFNISPSNQHPGLVSFRIDWLDLFAVQGTLKSLLQHHCSNHQFFSTQFSL